MPESTVLNQNLIKTLRPFSANGQNGTVKQTPEQILANGSDATTLLSQTGAVFNALTGSQTKESAKNDLDVRYVEEGLNAFSALTRRDANQTLELWAQELLEEITPYVEGMQAAFYLLSETPYPRLGFVGSYGLSAGSAAAEIKLGVGLVGQAAKSKRAFNIHYPDGIQTASNTGFARVKACAICVQPLMYEGVVEGVIEIVSAYSFTASHVEFLRKIGELLAANLRFSRIQEQMTDRLEQMVKDRTEELETTLENLKAAQMQIVQSEKMASLGQLIAGVAHEINTPIGAVKASAGNMQDILPMVLNDLPLISRSLNDAEVTLFLQLLSKALNGKPHHHLSSREERQFRKQIIAHLEERGVEYADEIARKLVENGIYDDLDTFIPLFKSSQIEQVIQLFYSMGQLKVNLDNITVAAEKTKRTVFALKTYVHRDSSDEPVPVNLKDNIDVILTLYLNQLKYGVDLTTDLEEDVITLGNSDELGQIWTNLIHNALQAMKNQGKLDIKVKREGRLAVVSITDNGPGIPKDIQSKIFEAFFTTKAKGEGTGLGLNIVRDILEKYDGAINLESEPGHTCFTVTLPLLEEL